MRILVLGSTGFLGGHITGHLRTLPGVRVLGGGRAPGPDVRVHLPIDLATVSVRGLSEGLRALAPDAVVNCAGSLDGSHVELAETNARGPAVLCEALRAAAPHARLVHLGSAAEYGPGAPAAAGQPLTEAAPTCPQGAYAATKLAGTLAVAAETALDAVVLRVFEPVGPGASGSCLPGRLADELERALPDGTVKAAGLSGHRDFVDVRDVARAAALAATASGPLPRVLNIGSGTATPVRAVAEGLARLAGFRGEVTEDGPGPASASPSAPTADVTAARTALGWQPELTLDSSLADLWATRSGVTV